MTTTVNSNYEAARAILDRIIDSTNGPADMDPADMGPADMDAAIGVAQAYALLVIADSLKELNLTLRHLQTVPDRLMPW